MSDHDALLAAILDDPADDLPRLALADWCEENGDMGRARFVRESMARPGEMIFLQEGGASLICTYADGTEHREPAPAGCDRAFWRRGLVEEVTITLAAWFQHRAGLMSTCPITCLNLADLGGWLPLVLHGWPPSPQPPSSGGPVVFEVAPNFRHRIADLAYRQAGDQGEWVSKDNVLSFCEAIQNVVQSVVYPDKWEAVAALSAALLREGLERARRRKLDVLGGLPVV